MDKIIQYYKLCDIKSSYFQLIIPFLRASHKKIVLNNKEVQLYYNKEFKTFEVIPSKIDNQNLDQSK